MACLLSLSLYRAQREHTSIHSCTGFPHKINMERTASPPNFPPCVRETEVAQQSHNSSTFSLCRLTIKNFIPWSCIMRCKNSAGTRNKNPAERRDDDACHGPLSHIWHSQGLFIREGWQSCVWAILLMPNT